MNKETKLFFEKLAGLNRNHVNEEEHYEESREEEDVTVSLSHHNHLNASHWSEEQNLDDFNSESEGQLTVDVYETPTSFVIKSAVAGVTPENLDIAITNESVSIRGSREEDEKLKNGTYLYQECYWGKFARAIILPQEIDSEKAQASLKNGILKIVLPKIIKTKSKKLKVKLE
jgi:HSP20 family protein